MPSDAMKRIGPTRQHWPKGRESFFNRQARIGDTGLFTIEGVLTGV